MKAKAPLVESLLLLYCCIIYSVYVRMSFYRCFMRYYHFHRCHVSIFAFISSFLFRQAKVSTHFRINRVNHTYKARKISFFMLDTITNHCSQILKFVNICCIPTMNSVYSLNKFDFRCSGFFFCIIHRKMCCREK